MSKRVPNLLDGYNKVTVISPIAFIFVHAITKQHSPKPSEDAISVKKFVQNFYDWYTPRALKADNEMRTLTEKAAMFTPQLRQALIEDRRAQEKVSDEIVGLDFDPFLNSQDPAEKYTVKKVEHKGNAWLATVFGRYKGQKEDTDASVVAQVERTKTGWRFTNFIYGKDNLLSELKQLKKDREKH